ncbi:hypothetical protein MMC30_000972 [Trapelia coarctata]|nr:hypothetical protein [Trapelia coarctata]
MGKELGVDPAVILATSHGRRSIDVLKIYDPSKANYEYVSQVEGLIPKEFGADAKEVPGSRALLASLDEADAPWAIVTSGTRPLVSGWLDRMRLTHPKHMIVAEDVEEGKPNSACYTLAKARLGLTPDDVALVIEDAPAGVKAGNAAGCRVVGLMTTHSIEQLKEAGADWIVEDMHSIKFVGKDKATGGLLKIELHRLLVM